MAELLGAVASGAGLASLAIQLCSATMKLKRFHGAVLSAPKNLEAVILEIETLSLLLRQIERDPPLTKSKLDPAVMAQCLEMCSKNTAYIEEVAAALEKSMQAHRTFGAVKTALKDRQLQDLFSKLERAKSTLTLAYQMYVQERQLAAQEQQTRRLEDQLTSILNQMALLGPQTRAVSMEIDEKPAKHGVLAAPQRRRRGKASSTTFWKLPFVNMVWQFSVANAPAGWDFHLTCFVPLPKTSAIFHSCRQGNLLAVRHLLDSGEASVHDQDAKGRSALHVRIGITVNVEEVPNVIQYAVGARSIELCDYLLAKGADPGNPLTLHHALNPFTRTLTRYLYPMSERESAVCKVIIRCTHFDADSMVDSDGYGSVAPSWYAMGDAELKRLVHQRLSLPYTDRPIHERFQRTMELPRSILQSDPDDLYTTLGTRDVQHFAMLQHEHEGTILHKAAEALWSSRLWKAGSKKWWFIIRDVIRAGADLHALRPAGNSHSTPLLVFLNPTEKAWTYKIWTEKSQLRQMVRKWAEGIAAAGADLLMYGQKESAIWRQLKSLGKFDEPWGTAYPHQQYRPSRLIFGSQASDWDVEVHSVLAVWKKISVPGAWPISTHWDPEYSIVNHLRAPGWEIERYVELKEPAKDIREKKSALWKSIQKRSWDDLDALAPSSQESWRKVCRLRRGKSVCTSVPADGREFPGGFTTVPIWPMQEHDERHDTWSHPLLTYGCWARKRMSSTQILRICTWQTGRRWPLRQVN